MHLNYKKSFTLKICKVANVGVKIILLKATFPPCLDNKIFMPYYLTNTLKGGHPRGGQVAVL